MLIQRSRGMNYVLEHAPRIFVTMVTVYSNMVEKMADNHDEEEHLARGKITRTFGEITFSSNFDSGN